jgi:flavodoxin
MKLKGIMIIAIAVVAVAILAVFAAMGSVIFDVMSNTATGHEALSPAGAEKGKALVVYNPGISGQAKGAAAKIAGDLQAKGYAVDLCGIRSAEAGKTAGYDVIVVGGPVYVGNASSSVKSYLSTLTPDGRTKLGVFGTGSVEIDSGDLAALRKDVASADNPLTIKAAMKLLEHDDADNKCAEFVDALLQ